MMKARVAASRRLRPLQDGLEHVHSETWQSWHETLSAIHCFKIEFFGADYEVKKLKFT